MTPERKRILRFVLIGLSISAGILAPFCIVLIQSAASDGWSINTCYSGELAGKINEEIADLVGFPLITLSKIPAGLPDEPHVSLGFTDTDCHLRILYGLYTEDSLHLEIVVFYSVNQVAEDGWKCSEDPSEDFETICYGDMDYSGKHFSIMLRSPYLLQETENLTAFVSITEKGEHRENNFQTGGGRTFTVFQPLH